MNNNFERIKGLKHATNLLYLILATLLLVACASGGGSGAPDGERGQVTTITTNPVGDTPNAFPDDGPVQYILSITRRDNATNPQLNLTATTPTGDDCLIMSTSTAPRAYQAPQNIAATASYDIAYTGNVTIGGPCRVTFTITEDNVIKASTSRNITFKPEQKPALVAEVIALGIPTSEPVIVNLTNNDEVMVKVTATKQDGSNTVNIIFPKVVMSSANNCAATRLGLDSRESHQYNGIVARTSNVMVTYSITSIDNDMFGVRDCSSFIFNGTEGSATGSLNFISNISFIIEDSDGDGIADHNDNCRLDPNSNQNDNDRDGDGDVCDLDDDDDTILDTSDNCPLIANPGQSDLNSDDEGDVCDTNSDNDGDTVVDADDVDADGDGLIELHNSTTLNLVRANLTGESLAGNANGCVAACSGYELVGDLDLKDLDDVYPGVSNWEPLGNCNENSCNGAMPQVFSGVFNGNGYSISNMRMHITKDSTGVGFLGTTSATTEIRNIHLNNVSISTEDGITANSVGGLVGSTMTKSTFIPVFRGFILESTSTKII